MHTIKLSTLGKNTFLISWLAGTILLLMFEVTGSWLFVFLGFCYIIIACIINMIVFLAELFAFITCADNRKSHGNSALLVLLNIPVALIYFFIFIKL